MYERFTDRARKVMIFANQEAQRLNHEYIGTEHILLGLVEQGRGAAAIVLQNQGIELRNVRQEIEKIVRPGPNPLLSGKLPQTDRAKKVIDHAIDEARRQKSDTVGTEHVLLGLMREEEGVAAQVLMNMGLTLGTLRQEVNTFFPPRRASAQTIQGEPPFKQEPIDLGELPVEINNEVQDLDRQITQLATEKDEAVSIQDFEKAALLRDRGDRLKKWRQTIVRLGLQMVKDQELARRVADCSSRITELVRERDEAVSTGKLARAVELRDELDRLQNQWQEIWLARKRD